MQTQKTGLILLLDQILSDLSVIEELIKIDKDNAIDYIRLTYIEAANLRKDLSKDTAITSSLLNDHLKRIYENEGAKTDFTPEVAYFDNN